MIDWLAIALRVLLGLFIFAIGLTLAKWIPNHRIRAITQPNRWFRQRVTLGLMLLTSLMMLGSILLVTDIVKVNSGQAEVVSSGKYQKNIRLGTTNVAIGGGGYVTGVYLHPLEKDLVYIRTDVGGFYRWDEPKQRWIPLTEHFPFSQRNYYGGEALAVDPNDPTIVYIAAGKYPWAEPGTLFKSTDKGQTWTKLNLDLKMGANHKKKWLGERLAVDPFNSNIILFGSREDGLWKSSDAGATWENVTSFAGKPDNKIGITAIVFDKQVPGLVYASPYGDGIYKSTDSGVSWTQVAGSPKTVNRMAVGKNNILYVTSTSNPGVHKYGNGVWKTMKPGGSNRIFGTLSVNPANPEDILVALNRTQKTKFYRSLDGGATWKQQLTSANNTIPWWPKKYFANHMAAMEFDPKVPGRVWFTDWYGVWRTDDLNANPVVWTNYAAGHEEVVPFTLVSPPRGPILVSGVADVDGFYHNQGLDTYPSQRLGLGEPGKSFQETYSIAYCETKPLQMVRVGGNRWNSTYTGATSSDGGLTWQQFASFPDNTMPMRVAMSATNPNLFVVTVSQGQPLRTTDRGVTWQKVSGLPNGPGGPWNWSQSLAADPVDGNRFYYYAKGKVYRSNDGGSSFQIVNDSLRNEGWHSLKTVPGVKGEIWLSLDRKGFYRSTDGGQSFFKLPSVTRAHLFAFGKAPQGRDTPALYIYGNIDGNVPNVENGVRNREATGTSGSSAKSRAQEPGIFQSLDMGRTWTRMGDRSRPIGNRPTVMEASKQEFGLVFIGTNGRGIYYGSQ
ncbi:MAG: hypothetical protein F6K55_16985 [Moorea sp. SIO4A3]|nr:hypothetical protein [Moorena sp. SIO4A3]